MPQVTQRSFTAGEIAPAARSRADIAKYSTALALCENNIVRAQGGVYSRPGTRFVAELDDSTRKARLIPFSFNTEQTYILVFEHLKMRVVKDAGMVLAGGGPSVYEIATPYTEADIPRLAFTQSADVMTIVHPDYEIRDLSRLADDNWTLAVNNYASTVSAPINLVAAAVGSGGGSNSKTYRYVVTAVDVDGVESLASAEVSITTGSLSVTKGVKLTWDTVVGADYYRVYKDPSNNTGVYGWIGDSTNAEFTDFNVAPITSDAPPEDRQPLSSVDNYPSAVNYYQQRQVFANTVNEPQAVYTTQTANRLSFRTSNPTRDDDAVTFTIAGRQVNEIRHIVSLNAMVLGTSGGWWKVTEGQDQVFTPATAGVRIQTYEGASWVPPAVINDTVVYVQEKGARIRDLNYEFTSDKYTGNDLSILAEHLFEGKQVMEMAFASEPYSILWCIMDDGVMLGLTYQREQQVTGWHRHTTQGSFESVATVTEGDRDAVYVIVKRNINGADVRYIERMEPRYTDDAVNAFCVDSGLTYSGSPVTVISGLDHLEGEEVAVLSDGNVVKGLTVASGSITLPRAASTVHVGLSYTPAIEMLDIEPSATVADPLKAKNLTVSRVVLEMEKSRGGWVGPKNDDGSTGDMYEIKPRFQSDGYGTITLKDFKFEVLIDPQWTKTGAVRIEQRDPLPMAILSVTPTVDVGGQ